MRLKQTRISVSMSVIRGQGSVLRAVVCVCDECGLVIYLGSQIVRARLRITDIIIIVLMITRAPMI